MTAPSSPGATAITTPGVLVRVHGCGLLITGASGTGKSEAALGLLDRGHQLVADDTVALEVRGGRLTGSAPEALRGRIEVRGVGICAVASLFGAGALRPETVIQRVVALEPDVDWAAWPRLDMPTDTTTLAGIPLPRLRLAVAPERPLPLLLEVIARIAGDGGMRGDADHD